MATSMAAATIGHVKLLRPLRERDFALLWAGMTVSLLGDGIFLVAEAWQVYDIENDPVALSLVGLAWTGGMTAFLLTGGIVSDRIERRRVLIAADLVRAVVLLVTGVLSLAGVLEIWHLVLLAALYGAGEAFFGPAFGALVPEIVAPHHLVEANSLDQLVRQACERLLGPAVGGAVVALIGAGGAFLVDAGTFAASAACIWGLRVRSLPTPAGIERSARRELREGVAFVRSQPWLWATLVAASLSLLLFLGPLEVLLPFVVRNDLDAGAWGYGAILSAAGAGSVVASLIVSQRGPPRRYLTFAYGMWTVSTVAFIGYAFGTSLWQFMAFAVVFGACETAGMVVWGTLMGSRVPAPLRGRVNSLDWFISIGLTPVSFALVGPISAGIGVDATLVLAGVLPMVVCVVLYLAAGLRRDEDLHPLLGDLEVYAGAGSSSADSGSGTPAIS
jgi:DHA3 family tetracycline resistance protein-like MFS transporter